MTLTIRLWLLAAALGFAALVGIGPSPVRAQAPQTVSGTQTLDSDGVIALIGKAPDLVIIDARRRLRTGRTASTP